MNKTIVTLLFLALLIVPWANSNRGIDTNPINSVIIHKKELTEMPNVIFMIGDGMGPEQIRAASLVEYGVENGSIMDTDFPVQGFYNTDTIDGKSTDSAASGTALATGQLSKIRAISVDETKTIYYKTILEYLQYDFGYSTGIVTDMISTHATPAVFGAHHDDRDEFEPIRQKMQSNGIDLILGAGLDIPVLGPDGESAKNKGEAFGYEVAVNIEELMVKAPTAEKLLGVFGGGGGNHVGYELERDLDGSPSILDMTKVALTFLEKKSNPYFVMIEGGIIDYAGHIDQTASYFVNKTVYQVIQTIVFEKAVRHALDVAKIDGNTIVIVAADHETGGLNLHDFVNLDTTLPNENNTREQNMAIRFTRINQLNTSYKWNAHTPVPVRFSGFGSTFGSLDLEIVADLFLALNRALGSFPTVLNQTYNVEGDMLTVKGAIKDLDSSAEKFALIVHYSNSTQIEFQFQLGATQVTKFEVTVSIDTTQQYSAYIKVYDSENNAILSFDNKNKLRKQSVTHLSSTPSFDQTTLTDTETRTSDSQVFTSISTTMTNPSSASISETSQEDDSPVSYYFLPS
ncbi:MAG: alkaline phosphatase, partial [Candidatus Heimdallarchaeota archaeon]|nr:alkaline phosphatase [Candidatus Heimdallarchaeota archaeon]